MVCESLDSGFLQREVHSISNIVKYRLHVWLEVTTEDGDLGPDTELETAQTLLKKNGASHHSQSETQFIENVS